MSTVIGSIMTVAFLVGPPAAVSGRPRTKRDRCGCEAKRDLKVKCAKCGFESLFDGKTLRGWQGDKKLWLVDNGMLIGRSPGIKRNAFLRTTRSFENFELRVTFRLLGGKGNSGFQFRSEKVRGHVKGYQADVGQNYWGWLYDERRRGKLVVSPPETKKHYKPDGWNEYVVSCQGPDIELKLNGFTTAKYTEKDAKIPRKGIIAAQLHGGGPMEIQIKDIRIKPLPAK